MYRKLTVLNLLIRVKSYWQMDRANFTIPVMHLFFFQVSGDEPSNDTKTFNIVTKVLSGDPVPSLGPYTKPLSRAIETVRSTIKNYSPYWSCLKYGVKLPHDMTDFKKQMVSKIVDLMQNNTIGELKQQDFEYTFLPNM